MQWLKIHGLAGILFVISLCTVSAETVTTTAGRHIGLLSGSTFRIIETEQPLQSAIDQNAPFCRHFEGEYGQQPMHVLPIAKNGTGKTVVGLRFTTPSFSSFGGELYSFSGVSAERVANNATSTSDIASIFDHNRLIGDEPFDILSVFHSHGTAKIFIEMIAVAFEGGEVVQQ